MTTEDRWTLYASAADKIVSLRSILRRASRAADPAYWHSRHAFVARVPYFAAFHTAAAPHLPPGMAGELARLVVRAEQATARDRAAAASRKIYLLAALLIAVAALVTACHGCSPL